MTSEPGREGLPGIRGLAPYGVWQVVQRGWAEGSRLGSHGKIALQVLFGKEAESQIMQSALSLLRNTAAVAAGKPYDFKPRDNRTRGVFLKDSSREARELNQPPEDRGRLL